MIKLNGAAFFKILLNDNIYTKLQVKIGAIFSLSLRPDFRWGNCLSFTLTE